jgi:hypothetical protein
MVVKGTNDREDPLEAPAKLAKASLHLWDNNEFIWATACYINSLTPFGRIILLSSKKQNY